jgi:hypothetical protein
MFPWVLGLGMAWGMAWGWLGDAFAIEKLLGGLD